MAAISPTDSSTLCLALLVVYLVYLIYRALISPKAHYPPGPRSYPIIGNLLDVPPAFQEITFTNLAKKYGAFYSVGISRQAQ